MYKMNHPTNTSTWEGKKIRYTWIKTKDFSKFSPITQVYGVVFDAKENILIGREPNNDWCLPGGTPETGESLEQTLKREVEEEVDAKIGKIQKLGIQKVEFIEEGKVIYQSRYIARLKKLLPQTEEPDKRIIWERKLGTKEDVLRDLKWGVSGKAIVEDALKLFHKGQ
jgi:ADP-ribose pyrophosphatase YjhB (NUDIX family)